LTLCLPQGKTWRLLPWSRRLGTERSGKEEEEEGRGRRRRRRRRGRRRSENSLKKISEIQA